MSIIGIFLENMMSRRTKLPLKGYILVGAVLFLSVTRIVVFHRLITADYPTHSDVFHIGVECGAIGVFLLLCLLLIGLLLYQLTVILRKV